MRVLTPFSDNEGMFKEKAEDTFCLLGLTQQTLETISCVRWSADVTKEHEKSRLPHLHPCNIYALLYSKICIRSS